MRVVLSLLAALAIAATAGGATGQPPALDPAYPPAPRAVGGGDPFAAQQPAQECTPTRAKPGPTGGYFPLSTLRSTRGNSPFLPAGTPTTILTLVNRKKPPQQFNLYVSGATTSAVAHFIKTASVCLERFPLERSIPPLVPQVQFDALLVAAASKLTELTQDDLAERRDQLGSNASFAIVVSHAGISPTRVVTAATAVAQQQLQSEVSAGLVTAAEVAALNIASIMNQLMKEQGAPFLFASSTAPITPPARLALLRLNPLQSIVMAMEPLNAPAKPEIVWFAIDPSISKGATHEFVAKCQLTSSAGIVSYEGRETLKFWRLSSPVVGTRTAYVPGAASPPSMTHTSTSPHTYDMNVTGIVSGDYYVAGNWVRGKGGGCR